MTDKRAMWIILAVLVVAIGVYLVMKNTQGSNYKPNAYAPEISTSSDYSQSSYNTDAPTQSISTSLGINGKVIY